MTLTALAYAHRLVVNHGHLPREAAEAAWNDCELHGGDRQAFIDAVEAAHITPTSETAGPLPGGTPTVSGGNDDTP